MNGRTARLIRAWCREMGVNYRRAKHGWVRSPGPQREAWKRNMQIFLAERNNVE